MSAVLVGIFLLASLLSSGCNFLKPKDITGPSAETYFQGTGELEIEFTKGTPPDELPFDVWANRNIIAGIEMANKGAYDITEGNIYVWHNEYLIHEGGDVGGYSLSISNLGGKSDFFPKGETRSTLMEYGNQEMVFRIKSNEAVGGADSIATISAKACYSYKTIATVKVCINPNPFETGVTFDSVCKGTQDISLSGGQGGPIAITGIKQATMASSGGGDGNSLANFRIYFSNAGKGDATTKELDDQCSTWNNMINIKVYRTQENEGRELLDCKSNGGVKYEDGSVDAPIKEDSEKNYITCTLDIERGAPAYETPLIIDISYNYITQEVQKKIKIVREIGSYGDSSEGQNEGEAEGEG